MQIFEFLMVLVSIVVGLGLAALLTGVADALRARREVRIYWIHTLVVAGVFLAFMQIWWESWSLQRETQWTFVGMLMMLGGPLLLFLVAHVLFPQARDHTDLADYYYEISPIIWLLAAAAVVVGTLFRPVVFGESLLSLDHLSSLPTLLICLFLGFTQKRPVHAVLVPTLVLLVFLDVVLINRIIDVG